MSIIGIGPSHHECSSCIGPTQLCSILLMTECGFFGAVARFTAPQRSALQVPTALLLNIPTGQLSFISSATHISQVHSSSEGQLPQPLPHPPLPLYMECPSPLHYPVKRSMVLEASDISPCLLNRRHPSPLQTGTYLSSWLFAAKQNSLPRSTCPNCRWSLLA